LESIQIRDLFSFLGSLTGESIHEMSETLTSGTTVVADNESFVAPPNSSGEYHLDGVGDSIVFDSNSRNDFIFIGNYDTVIFDAKSINTVVEQGNHNTVDLEHAHTIISIVGTDNTAEVDGGQATIVIDGSLNNSPNNGPLGGLVIGANGGNIDVFGWNLKDSVDLLSSFGFKSTRAIVNHITSDGHGGSVLLLNHGCSGSIDFVNVAPQQLHADQFHILHI
jgi:hypothetical protein